MKEGGKQRAKEGGRQGAKEGGRLKQRRVEGREQRREKEGAKEGREEDIRPTSKLNSDSTVSFTLNGKIQQKVARKLHFLPNYR